MTDHDQPLPSLAENLSFTRAAESLFLTQSAVSHQIADLERTLGVELFVRHGRTIELTAAGRVLTVVGPAEETDFPNWDAPG